jgi:histidinol dehydrogenase
VREADKRITAYARAGKKKAGSKKTPMGGQLGEKLTPFDRVGVYIPGGSAPLASTVMMTVTLARVAGVREIVACTPARKDGSVNPYLLYALREAGATEVYRVGGIQAIGLMAYGTHRIGRVQKIAGPGGPYVTAAKRAVYGDVALDMVAGPSEIAVLADATGKPGVCCRGSALAGGTRKRPVKNRCWSPPVVPWRGRCVRKCCGKPNS